MSTTSRVIVAHDYFDIRGGGERLALTMANALDSSLVCGFRTSQSYDLKMFPQSTIELGLPLPLRKPGVRTAALALRFAMARSRMRPYKTRIFSGVSAPFAAEETSDARNIFYCHTPPRFLYDQREHFSSMTAGNPVRRLALDQFRRGYEAAVGHMDLIVANSMTVRDRIRDYLNRDAVVIYPPCDLGAFQWRGQQDFYLSTARHSPLKRVDKIIEAFLKMPNKKLVVASGGEDSVALQRLAANAPNITFLGWVDERHLQRLVGEAVATIYVPVDEDFGMSPVESMAAGKPVIGVAEGGLRETIINGETGILLPTRFTSDDLASSVQILTPARAAAMQRACVSRAALFSKERFVKGMRQIVE